MKKKMFFRGLVALALVAVATGNVFAQNKENKL
jgi:hypothetical protein